MKLPFLSLALFFSFAAAAQKVPAITGSNVSQVQAEEALRLHNKARADVGVPALEWSADLAAYAQAWANHLASSGCKMQHRPSSGKWAQLYGENIFWGSGKSYTALNASQSWYEEIKYYKPKKDNRSKTGHYTQMVWRSTTRVGIGTATCSNGSTIIVANYSPAGNYAGQKPY